MWLERKLEDKLTEKDTKDIFDYTIHKHHPGPSL